MTSVPHHTYTVLYDSSSHWSVLTQMRGSVWPKVLPYCIFNVVVMSLISYLKLNGIVNLAITSQGHSFVTLVVAFLLVNRVSIALARYNEARGYLAGMCGNVNELVQSLFALTAYENADPEAQEWRFEVCHRALLLLRLSMVSIDYPNDSIPGWRIPEFAENASKEFEYVKRHLPLEGNSMARRWVHKARTEYEENLRVPVRMAYLLRQTIHRHTLKTVPLAMPYELKLLAFVDIFMNNYYGMAKFLTTPVPFPLIQMARTFLFFYIFTVPFALLSDTGSSPYAHIGIVFILTFGFKGLEAVAMELDDPFGDDPNDFDNLAMAETAFEDIYLAVMDLDGPDYADRLRASMQVKSKGVSFSEQSWLLSPA